MKFLRSLVYQRHDGVAVCEITVLLDYERRVLSMTFADAHAVLDMAERLRMVGNEMLRDAPRPGER